MEDRPMTHLEAEPYAEAELKAANEEKAEQAEVAVQEQKRFREWMREVGDRNVKVKFILPWLLFLLLGLAAVWHTLDAENDRALESQSRADAAAIAEVSERAYVVCVARVEGRSDQRKQWISFYDALTVLYRNNPKVVDLISNHLKSQLDVNLPELDVNEACSAVDEPLYDDDLDNPDNPANPDDDTVNNPRPTNSPKNETGDD